MSRRSGSKPAGVHPKGQPHRTNMYENFIPVFAERKVYILKDSGLRVLRVAGAVMATNLPRGHEYQEIFLDQEEFARRKREIDKKIRRIRAAAAVRQ